jgi:GNAT superfamily N-acetyltransferase
MIRRATIYDLLPLALLFDQYRVFYRKNSNKNAAEVFLKARIENDESVIFVHLENGILTGFVQLYPLYSSTNMKKLWLLNDLYVNDKHRGKGISKKLINAAKDLCKETDAVGLMLETEKSNIIGNQLYPNVDFLKDEDHNYYFWNNNH